MTLLTPSLISPATSKLLSYLPFSNHNKTHAQQQSSSKSPDLPTYITIVMRKDGTPTTKCLNPPPVTRLTMPTRRRRSSFSSLSLSSPPKQRRLMISSLISRFPRKNSSSSLSYSSRSSSISSGLTAMIHDQLTGDCKYTYKKKVACQIHQYLIISNSNKKKAVYVFTN